MRYDTFFESLDVITTSIPLVDKTLKRWRLVKLSAGGKFLSKHPYQEKEIQTDNFEDDREFLVVNRYEVSIETIEQEDYFFNDTEELQKEAIFFIKEKSL